MIVWLLPLPPMAGKCDTQIKELLMGGRN